MQLMVRYQEVGLLQYLCRNTAAVLLSLGQPPWHLGVPTGHMQEGEPWVMPGLVLSCLGPAEGCSQRGSVAHVLPLFVVAYRKQTALESKYLSAWKSLSERQPEGFGV